MLEDVPAWIQPEYELLIAMIHRAVFDLNNPLEREEAIEWLTDSDATKDEVMSFPWVIFHLGLELSVIRRYVYKAIDKSKLSKSMALAANA